jgi:hypothetical protein
MAWLGGVNREVSVLQQRVTVNPSYATLAYYIWIESNDECLWDYFIFSVDEIQKQTTSLCYYSRTGGWVKKTFSLNGYGGKTVLLRWMEYNDTSYPSHLFLDDIGFEETVWYP